MNKMFNWIDSERNNMLKQVTAWANINSGTHHLFGLDKMNKALIKSALPLKAKVQEIKLKPYTKIDIDGSFHNVAVGKALSFKKIRPKAKIHILLGGHNDTVYPIESSFQKARLVGKDKLLGPGVADMKGGLAVMLKALEALEKDPIRENISWEIIINPDEEIGSPSSKELWKKACSKARVGLLFEPAFSDGSFVNERKGSKNFTLLCHGKASHSGRAFFDGKHAIAALAKAISVIHHLSNLKTGFTVNVGFIQGGTSSNIVPDFAMVRLNMRFTTIKQLESAEEKIKNILSQAEKKYGVSFELHSSPFRAPKAFDRNQKKLFDELGACAKELSIPFKLTTSGGVCDGNDLAMEGLRVIDTLGVVGGHLHSPEEYLHIPSLTERAKLTYLLLTKLAG